MRESEWLAGLKEGDEVVFHPNRSSRKVLTKIKRLTQTMFILEDGQRIRRKDGNSVGNDNWHFTFISQPTEEARASIAEDRDIFSLIKTVNSSTLVSLHSVNLGHLKGDLEYLKELAEVVKKYEASKET